jgi:uncharacterized membrane protein
MSPTFWGFIGGMPLHPLIVHATVIFIILTALGAIVLAVKPNWRHRFGWLTVLSGWLSALFTWLAVESGNVLTAVPGLGATPHAVAGTQLLFLVIPFAIIITIMILLDRQGHWNKNKHGDTWRWHGAQSGFLKSFCVLAVVGALTVVGQTVIVGHSGAVASWGDVHENQVLIKDLPKD